MPLKLCNRKGSVNWFIRGTVRGQSVFESTGTSNREAAEEIRVVTEARLLQESIHGKKALIRFEEAAESYAKTGAPLRYILDISRTTGEARGLAVHFRGKLLKDIAQNDLDDAARKLYGDAAPETLNRQCYTPFIAIWNHAVKNNWADMRLWQRPRKRKGTHVRKGPERAGTRPVAYEHAAQFVSHLSPAQAQAVTALFFTGMRPIELFALEKQDIDIEKRWVTVRSSKTGEPRGVPMHEFLVPLFTSLLKRDDGKPQVFRNHRGEPYPLLIGAGGQMSTAIEGARRRCGIKDISLYTARHTVSTQLIINGVHAYVKDQILGHAADSMSRHYTNIPQAPLIAAINTITVPDLWRQLDWWGDPLAAANAVVKWAKYKKWK